MADSSDSGEDDPQLRSRTSAWRHYGSKRKRFEQDEDREAANPQGGSNIRGCANDAPTSSQSTGVLAATFPPPLAQEAEVLQHAGDDRDDSSDESWCSDYEAEYLGEMPNAEDNEPYEPVGGFAGNLDDSMNDFPDPDVSTDPEDPPDSDEPPDPEDPHGSSSEEQSDDEQNFNLDHESLDRAVVLQEPRSVRELLLLDLAASVRHKLTYECLIDLFKGKNALCGSKFFPTSTKELWRVMGRNSSGITEHAYCSACSAYMGLRSNLEDLAQCVCGFRIQKNMAKYFVSLSLRKQLQHFLSTPGVDKLLKYREDRVKRQEDAIEDVFDAEHYKYLRQTVMGERDFIYVFNTDGGKLSKGARTSIYPIFVRLNEIRPQLRQKFMFLAGVFVDTTEPNMTVFLEPFVHQMNRLSEKGIKWIPVPGGPEVESKFFPLCFCVDEKARAQILNMNSHSGYHGCTFCTCRGVSVGRVMRWPALQHPNVPPYEDRTDEGMKRDMIEAINIGENVCGHKGATPLMLSSTLNLRKCSGLDDLHHLYLCAAPHITELILQHARRVEAGMGLDRLLNLIDARLVKIKTPSCISRKPGNTSISNRGKWTGTEWRNWLLYYSVPCLEGLINNADIKHLQYLSRPAYLLSQDLITSYQLTEAEQCISRFLQLNEEKYGIERTKLNLHALTHFPRSVRELGPLWCYSTFFFESWNHKTLMYVTSPKGAIMQIVTRHLINNCIFLAFHSDDNISPKVQAQLEVLLKERRLAKARLVSEDFYVLGKSSVRNVSEEENAVLMQEGIVGVTNMEVFERAVMKSAPYCTKEAVNLEAKSDNSTIYTYLDTFCTIQCFVVFETEDGQEISGLFVKEHTMLQESPFSPARHISSMVPGADLLHFLSAKEVRSPVVKVKVAGCTYLVPLPNHLDID